MEHQWTCQWYAVEALWLQRMIAWFYDVNRFYQTIALLLEGLAQYQRDIMFVCVRLKDSLVPLS